MMTRRGLFTRLTQVVAGATAAAVVAPKLQADAPVPVSPPNLFEPKVAATCGNYAWAIVRSTDSLTAGDFVTPQSDGVVRKATYGDAIIGMAASSCPAEEDAFIVRVPDDIDRFKTVIRAKRWRR